MIDCSCNGSTNQWQVRSNFNGAGASNVKNVAVIGGTYTLNIPNTAKGCIRFMAGKYYSAYDVVTSGPFTTPIDPNDPNHNPYPVGIGHSIGRGLWQ